MQDITSIQAYVPAISIFDLLPFMALLVGALFCLIVDAASDKEGSRRWLPFITMASLAGSALLFLFDMLPSTPFMEASFRADEFGQLGAIVILFSALVMTFMSPAVIEKRNLPSGEYYTLINFAAFGMVSLACANELLTAFVCLEIMSLSLYVLTGIDRRSGRAAEAAFKYFILGAFASAFLVFGIAFLYGATGTTYLHEMAELFRADTAVRQDINPLWVSMGFALFFVGVCFKLSLAPFHMYTPDVYQGANTPTTMVIATGSKVAAIALLVHVVEPLSFWMPYSNSMIFIIGFAAAASMIWGNLAALVQTNIKRMLAFSSVAHTGYTVVGVLVLMGLPATGLAMAELDDAQRAIREAILLYMAGYTVMNVLAFGIAQHIGGEGHMGSYRGLAQRKPLAAFGMAVAMFSLLGIPPTVGFMGKFYVFKEAVQHGFVEIAVLGVLASVVSAFYYLSLVVTMFMREETEEIPGAATLAGQGPAGVATGLSSAALVASAALVFLFGLIPSLFFALSYNLGIGG